MATKEIIAIDFGSHEIKVLRYDLKERSVSDIRRFFKRENENETRVVNSEKEFENEVTKIENQEDSEQNSVSEIWKDDLVTYLGDTSHSRIIVNIPDSIVAVMNVEVPFSERQKVESVLPHLLSDKLPLDLKKIVYNFYAFDSEHDDESVAKSIVAFAKKTDIENYLSELQEFGLDPAHLAVPSIILGNLADDLFGKKEEVVAYLDIGHQNTAFTILKNGHPILARTIRSGGGKITGLISKRFGQTFAESKNIKHKFAVIVPKDDVSVNDQTRLVSATIVEGLSPILRDARRSFQGLYSSDGIEIDSLLICGGTSRIKNIERYFSDELGVRTRRFHSDILEDDAGELVMAAGLLRIGINEKLMSKSPNLRTGEFAYLGGGSAIKKRMIRFGIAALILVMVLFGIFILQKKGHEARRNAMQATLLKESKKLFGYKTMSSKKVREALAEGEEDTRSFIPKMSAYEMMHEITTKISSEVVMELSRIEVGIPRKVIQITGSTTDAQAVDRIVSDLREIECLKKVTPGATKLKNDKAQFTISIVSGCS